MSTDFRARAVAGIKITYGEILARMGEKKERCCKHPETKQSFCGECGKPMWREVKIYEDDILEFLSEKVPKLVVQPHYGQNTEKNSDQAIYLGLSASADVGEAASKLFSPNSFKKNQEECKEAMKALKLPEDSFDDRYGIWVFLNVS